MRFVPKLIFALFAAVLLAAACSAEDTAPARNTAVPETSVPSPTAEPQPAIPSVTAPNTSAPPVAGPVPSAAPATATSATGGEFPLTIAEEINNPKYERGDYSPFRSNVDRDLGWNTENCKWGFYASTPRNCPTEGSGRVNNRDHMVPVADAHKSGGYAWDRARKKDFYSHTDNLFVISASENKTKGGRDPSEWRPENPEAHCQYAQTWIEIKTEWNLTADKAEADALKTMLATC